MVDLTTNPPSVSSWQTGSVPVLRPEHDDHVVFGRVHHVHARRRHLPRRHVLHHRHDGCVSSEPPLRQRESMGGQRRRAGQMPTWVDWAGGDTFWGVGTTGAAIYVGGHPRWMNNPYRSNAAGPGAVPREGIAGLDPINGLPFTWNPGRAAGVGTFDIVGTPDGLFVGSDTDRFGGETRRKIAFLPLAGGTVVPPNVPYGLPNDLYRIDEATSTLTRRVVRRHDVRPDDHAQHRRELGDDAWCLRPERTGSTPGRATGRSPTGASTDTVGRRLEHRSTSSACRRPPGATS